MFFDDTTGRHAQESSLMDDMMADMLSVDTSDGHHGIEGGARNAAVAASGGGSKTGQSKTAQSEREQANALKSWDDSEESLVTSQELSSSGGKKRHVRKKGHKKQRSNRKKRTSNERKSPKTSSGKALLRPHGLPTSQTVGNRKSTKVMPVAIRKEVTTSGGYNNFKAIGKLIKLQHGVQAVQSGRHPVTCVAFESHGERMFVATEQGEATVWPTHNVGTSDHEVHCVPTLTKKVTTCHFEGGKVVTGYGDGGCLVYDAENGKQLMKTIGLHEHGIEDKNPGKLTTCSISEDGKCVMMGGGGWKKNDRCGWLYIRDIATGKKLFGFIGRTTMKDVWKSDDVDGDGIDDTEQKHSTQAPRKSSFLGRGMTIHVPKSKATSKSWMKARRSKKLLLAVQRKPVSTFSSVPRSCDFMTYRRKTTNFFGEQSVWPRTIIWGGKDKICNIWRLINPNGSKCHVLHTIKFKAQIGACAFSPDASLMCIGTYAGILKIFEAESGVLVQTFKDKIQSQIPRTTGPGVDVESKIVKITVVKETANADKSKEESALDQLGGVASTLSFGLLGKGKEDLKGSASYNNDLVVYVHELKKPNMCHVLVRDIISGALLHAYDVAEVQSCFAIWASKLTVILAGKPRNSNGHHHNTHTFKGGPEMSLAVRDLDLSAIQHTIIHKGGHREEIVCVAVSNDGARIAIGAKSARVSIYNCDAGQRTATATMAIPPDGKVANLAFMPTNSLLLMTCGKEDSTSKFGKKKGSSSEVGYVCCRDTTDSAGNGQSTSLWRVKVALPATCIEFNPSGDTMCVCMAAKGWSVGEIAIMNPLDGTIVHRIEKDPTNPDELMGGILACSFQDMGVLGLPPLITASGYNGMMHLWNADTMENHSELLSTSHDVHCTTCAFSPNGMYLVSGDCQGTILLRLFCMVKQKVTLVQKSRWEMGGQISGCVFLAAGMGSNMYLGYSYVDNEEDPPVKKSQFKTMLQPSFPDHAWWNSIVDQAGGAIIGTIGNGKRGLVVEDLHTNKVCTMDLTSTAPSPSEMPQKGENCGQWIKATPHLIHRQDRLNSGKTILHTLCETGTVESLESYLYSVSSLGHANVAPIVDEIGRTPLDVALDNNEYRHCQLLLDAYIKNNISALASLKKPLCLLAIRYPDLMADFLRECTNTVHSKHIRLPLDDRGLLLCSQNVDSPWNKLKTDEITNDGDKRENVTRPVEAHIMGFPGFISADGPFFSVVRSGHLEIFDTDAMRMAIRYKWETYGFYMYTVQSGIYFAITTMFTLAMVMEEAIPVCGDPCATGGEVWYMLNIICMTLSLIFIIIEAREVMDDGWRTYFTDLQNYLHLWGSIGMWFPVIKYLNSGTSSKEIDAVTLIVNWLNMLGYLRGFKLTGSLVRMLIAVVVDMRGFVLLVLMLIIGFSASFTLLLSHEDGFDLRTSPFTVFNMMLGNIELHWFDDPHMKDQNETHGLKMQNGDLTTMTRSSWVAVISDAVFVLFNALIVIIMLNLLIAILGNTYSRIAQHEKVQMEYERAKCIYEIERHFMPSFVLKYNKFFPRFLHSLRPASAKGINDDTMEYRLKERMDDIEEKSLKKIEYLRSNMNSQISKIILLLEPGTRISRKDHEHPIRAVHLHLWARTFAGGKWRCSACMQDFDYQDPKVSENHELVFVCENHYPHSKDAWKPPHRCAFCLCSTCVRNEVRMSDNVLEGMQNHDNSDGVDSDFDVMDSSEYSESESEYSDYEEEEEEED